MKRTTCPRCKTPFKLRSAGNQNGEKFKITRKNRFKLPRSRSRTVEGSKYQMVLSCGCNAGPGKVVLTTILARSKAEAMHRLNRWSARKIPTA